MDDDKICFPRNVTMQYEVARGLGWKEIKRYVLPAILIVLAIILLPPYNSVLFWIFKVLIFTLAFVVVIFFVGLKPVSSRSNITLEMWIRDRRKYNKRQKVFYMDKKDKSIHG